MSGGSETKRNWNFFTKWMKSKNENQKRELKKGKTGKSMSKARRNWTKSRKSAFKKESMLYIEKNHDQRESVEKYMVKKGNKAKSVAKDDKVKIALKSNKEKITAKSNEVQSVAKGDKEKSVAKDATKVHEQRTKLDTDTIRESKERTKAPKPDSIEKTIPDEHGDCKERSDILDDKLELLKTKQRTHRRVWNSLREWRDLDTNNKEQSKKRQAKPDEDMRYGKTNIDAEVKMDVDKLGKKKRRLYDLDY